MKPNQGDVKAVLRDDQKDKDDEENDDDVEYIDFEKWMNEWMNIPIFFKYKIHKNYFTIHTLIK